MERVSEATTDSGHASREGHARAAEAFNLSSFYAYQGNWLPSFPSAFLDDLQRSVCKQAYPVTFLFWGSDKVLDLV